MSGFFIDPYNEVQPPIVFDTAAGFTSSNRILLPGQFGVEVDTRTFKIGDGETAWNSLPYFGGSGGGTVDSVVGTASEIDVDSSDPANPVVSISAMYYNAIISAINGILVEYATNAYAESLVVGLWDDRGNFDASGNTFPAAGGSGSAGAILKGDIWTVSVGGTLGGNVVAAGDTVRALVDTPGQTSSNWAVAENNIGYVPENSANKDTDSTFAANSDTKYPSQKAVKTALDAKSSYVLKASNNTSFSPADGVRYFFGSLASAGPTSTESIRRIPIPKTGTITRVAWWFRNPSTLASNETTTMNIRVDAGSDNQITNGLQFNSPSVLGSVDALNISVTRGQYIELNFAPTTWATNPGSILFDIEIFIET